MRWAPVREEDMYTSSTSASRRDERRESARDDEGREEETREGRDEQFGPPANFLCTVDSKKLSNVERIFD